MSEQHIAENQAELCDHDHEHGEGCGILASTHAILSFARIFPRKRRSWLI